MSEFGETSGLQQAQEELGAVEHHLSRLAPALVGLAEAALNGTLEKGSSPAIVDVSDRLEEVSRHLRGVVTTADILLDNLPEDDEPEVIHFTGDETYDMFRRYVGRRNGMPFTVKDVAKHLESNHVEGIPDGRKMRSWLLDIQADIRDDLLAQNDLDGRWLDWPVGREKGFVFAPVQHPKPVSPPVEASVESPAAVTDTIADVLPPAPMPERVATPEETPKPDPVMTCVLQAVGDDSQRRNTIINALEGTGLTRHQIVDAISSLTTQGQLFAYRSEGRVMVTRHVEVAEASTLQKRFLQLERKERQATHHLDQALAKEILDMFIQPRVHVSQHKTAREIHRYLSKRTPDLSERFSVADVTKAARILEKLGILAMEKKPLNKGGHRSSSQLALKFGLKSQEMHDQIMAAGGRSALDALIVDALKR